MYRGSNKTVLLLRINIDLLSGQTSDLNRGMVVMEKCNYVKLRMILNTQKYRHDQNRKAMLLRILSFVAYFRIFDLTS